MGNFTSSILLEFDARDAEDGGDATLGGAVRRTQEQLWSDMEHLHIDGVQLMQERNRQSKQTFQAVAPFAFVSTLGLVLAGADGEDGDTGAAYRRRRRPLQRW